MISNYLQDRKLRLLLILLLFIVSSFYTKKVEAFSYSGDCPIFIQQVAGQQTLKKCSFGVTPGSYITAISASGLVTSGFQEIGDFFLCGGTADLSTIICKGTLWSEVGVFPYSDSLSPGPNWTWADLSVSAFNTVQVSGNLSVFESADPLPDVPHLGCQSNACVLDNELSEDLCFDGADCIPVPNPGGPGRFECSGNSCSWNVNGSGANQCGTNSDCIAVTNNNNRNNGPSPSHWECAGYTCTNVGGAGTDQCVTTTGSCGAPTPDAYIDCQSATSGYVSGGPCTVQVGEQYTIFGSCVNGDDSKNYTIRNDTGEVWPAGPPFFGSPIVGNSPITYTTYCYYQFNLLPTQPISATLQIFPPTLSANLTANPNSGASPLDVTLTAQSVGTANGTTNFSFWWNCADNTTNVATATTACGALPAPGPGFCSSNANGLKCNALNLQNFGGVRTYTPADVVWQNPVGVNVSDNNLTKNVRNNNWDGSGASSDRGFTGDGYTQFTASEVTSFRYIGLSHDTTHQWNQIDYGIYLAADNQLYIAENGTYKLSWSPGDINTWYTTGDTLKIVVTSNQVTYWKNGVNIYTSLIAPTYPLFVDTSFNTNGATVWNVKISPVPSHTYLVSSTAKVIVEQGGLSAQAQAAITIIGPPPVLDSAVTMPLYCSSGPGGTISWTVTSGGPQESYRVQVDDDSGFGSPNVDSCPGGPPNGTCANGNLSTSYVIPTLLFDTIYYARVMIWDNAGQPSVWTSISSCNNNNPPNTANSCLGNTRWRTPLHAYPDVNGFNQFTWSPPNPAVGSLVQFTDNTSFDPTSVGKTWDWTFTGGNPANSNAQNPVDVTFPGAGLWPVTLTASDNIGSCQLTRNVIIQRPLPKWREVAPR